MDLWTIIPVKPFGLGKSRLAPVLSAPERAALNRAMFEHVLRTAIAAFGAARIVVVTADAEAASLAGQHAAQVLPEHTADDLNGALASGMTYVRARGAEAALVLPSDLPHLGRDDLMAISAALRQTPCCVVAPDLSRIGTNALAVAPPDETLLRFGPGSFAAHVERARARNHTVQIVSRPGLAFDLDTPDDYRACINDGEPAWLCAAFSAPHAAPAS